MMSPRERYCNDANFHSFVEIILKYVEGGRFTPTEMQEAVLLAHIIYNGRHVGMNILPFEIKDWLNGESDSILHSGSEETK